MRPCEGRYVAERGRYDRVELAPRPATVRRQARLTSSQLDLASAATAAGQSPAICKARGRGHDSVGRADAYNSESWLCPRMRRSWRLLALSVVVGSMASASCSSRPSDDTADYVRKVTHARAAKDADFRPATIRFRPRSSRVPAARLLPDRPVVQRAGRAEAGHRRTCTLMMPTSTGVSSARCGASARWSSR